MSGASLGLMLGSGEFEHCHLFRGRDFGERLEWRNEGEAVECGER